MLSPALRALSASAAIASFLGGVAGLVIAPSPLFAVLLFVALVFAAPAMFFGRKPHETDLPRIEEDLHRYRSAMLICFAAAAAVYATVITLRYRLSADVLQRLSSLGVALWLVAFVLLFFVAYYGAQRRMTTR